MCFGQVLKVLFKKKIIELLWEEFNRRKWGATFYLFIRHKGNLWWLGFLLVGPSIHVLLQSAVNWYIEHKNFEFHLVRGELQFGGIERLARQWISLFLSRPSCGTRRGWSCCRQTYHRLGRCDRPEPYPRSSSSESRSRTFYGNSKNKFIQYSKSITQMQLISC